MAVALVTNEAEQSERLKKIDWTKKQLRQKRREAEEECAAREAAELPANCRRAPGERRSSSRRNNHTCNMIETGIVEPGTIH